MTRNGGIAKTFRAAFQARTVPATGVTLKMLVHQLLRQGVQISADTLERYRDDTTTIPGAAIQALDTAFSHLRCPGFMSDVLGVEPGSKPPAERHPVACSADDAASVNQAAGGDYCLWATHEGSLHTAAMGHGEFARRYFGLPVDTESDPRRFAIDNLGWLALTRLAEGGLRLEGDASRNAAARDKVVAWLERQGGTVITGAALPKAMPADEAAAFLRALTVSPPASEWSAQAIGEAELTDTATRELWRAVHEAGVQRAHMVDLAGRIGVLDRCSIFIVDGEDVISAHVGAALPIDRGVVGRNVLARRDQGYAQQVRSDVLATLHGPTITRIRRTREGVVEGGYDRIAVAQETGPGRYQVLTSSGAIWTPQNFQPLQ